MTKNIFIYETLKSRNFEKTTFLGLKFRTRFWTFLEMSKIQERQSGLGKPEKTTCEHNALISVFL